MLSGLFLDVELDVAVGNVIDHCYVNLIIFVLLLNVTKLDRGLVIRIEIRGDGRYFFIPIIEYAVICNTTGIRFLKQKAPVALFNEKTVYSGKFVL